MGIGKQQLDAPGITQRRRSRAAAARWSPHGLRSFPCRPTRRILASKPWAKPESSNRNGLGYQHSDNWCDPYKSPGCYYLDPVLYLPAGTVQLLTSVPRLAVEMGHYETGITAVDNGPGFDNDQRFPITRIGSVVELVKQALLLLGGMITLLRLRLLQHRRVFCQTCHVADRDGRTTCARAKGRTRWRRAQRSPPSTTADADT